MLRLRLSNKVLISKRKLKRKSLRLLSRKSKRILKRKLRSINVKVLIALRERKLLNNSKKKKSRSSPSSESTIPKLFLSKSSNNGLTTLPLSPNGLCSSESETPTQLFSISSTCFCSRPMSLCSSGDKLKLPNLRKTKAVTSFCQTVRATFLKAKSLPQLKRFILSFPKVSRLLFQRRC